MFKCFSCFKADIVSVSTGCCKCFRYFKRMLQVFHRKVFYRNVAKVAQLHPFLKNPHSYIYLYVSWYRTIFFRLNIEWINLMHWSWSGGQWSRTLGTWLALAVCMHIHIQQQNSGSIGWTLHSCIGLLVRRWTDAPGYQGRWNETLAVRRRIADRSLFLT